jgi:hypothetical protein
MVQLDNGDRDGDGDSLHFYVAITLPQMPMSEIDHKCPYLKSMAW